VSLEAQPSSVLVASVSVNATCLQTIEKEETVTEFLPAYEEDTGHHGERKTSVGVLNSAEGSADDVITEESSMQNLIERENQVTGNENSLNSEDSSTNDAMKLRNSGAPVACKQNNAEAVEQEPGERVDSDLVAASAVAEAGASGSCMTAESTVEKESVNICDFHSAARGAAVEDGASGSCVNEDENLTVQTKCKKVTSPSHELAAGDDNGSSGTMTVSEGFEGHKSSELAKPASSAESIQLKSSASKGQMLYARIAPDSVVESSCMETLANDDNPLVNQATAAAVEDNVQTLTAAVTSDEIQSDTDKKKKNKKQRKKEKKEKEEKEKEEKKKESEKEKKEKDKKEEEKKKKEKEEKKKENEEEKAEKKENNKKEEKENENETAGTEQEMKSRQTAAMHESVDSSNKSVDANKPGTSVDSNQKKASDARVSRFQFVLLFIYAFL
jgi:outer membrane biosynthesis protein TonB